MQYQPRIMTFKIIFGQACNVWGSFFSVTQRQWSCSPLLCLGFPVQQGSHCLCGHRALLARASSRMFPSGENAGDCIKHRKGERQIQVVCVKPGLHDRQGQVGLRTEQIWGLSLSAASKGTAPSASSCFPAASSCPGPRPCGTLTQSSPCFCTSAHLLHHGPWQGLRRWQPGPALLPQPPKSPLSLPAPAWSKINLMAGWWQIVREPCPLWLA